jgi:hypothetical protein
MKSGWWYCLRCGFANHPRANAAPVYVQAADGRFDVVSGDSKCEQCGKVRTADDVDYQPTGA